MMNSLVIYAHPWEGSFSNAVKDHVLKNLKEQEKSVDLIDLNVDGFNPVMEKGDLRLFGKGEYADPLAKDYVERLKKADEVFFIFPIWWYSEPAILKGFFDKVFLKGTTYVQKEYEIQGVLNINKGAVITSGTIDKDYFRILGDPIENVLIKGTLGMVGIKNISWIHCSSVHLEESRKHHFEEIDAYFKVDK